MVRRRSRLSHKDLAFIAQDIGTDLIAVMEPEEILKALSAKQRQEVLLQIIVRMSAEELINNFNLQQQMYFLKVLLNALAEKSVATTKSAKQMGSG